MPLYRLSPLAYADVVAIYVNGFDLFGPIHADRYQAGLTRTFDFLAEYPRAARLREEVSPPVRVFRYKSHLIFYELDPDDVVMILRVRHGREEWMSDA